MFLYDRVVRYLRMLSNSVIAGGLAAGYLTVLVLQLNPHYPIDPGTIVPLALTLGAAYGINLTVAFYALIVFRQILAVEVLSPGWVSVRLLSWLLTIAATGGAAVMWLNLRGFSPVLDVETARRMAAGAIVVSAASVVFLMIGLAHLGRRGGRSSATILVLTALMSVVMSTVLRGPARAALLPPRLESVALREPAPGSAGGRVFMMLLDGASLDVIAPAVAEGRLPNFGRIFDGGSVMHLATLRPTQAETVWSAVATGRTPMHNGVRSSASYRALGVTPAISLLPDYCFAQALVRFGFLWEQPHTASDLDARPLWSILSDQGVTVGVIGWPLTQPVSPVRGYLVSDTFHRLSGAELDLEGIAAVWPPSMLEAARASLTNVPEPDPVALVSVMGGPPAGDYDMASDPDPVVADRVHAALLDAFAGMPARFGAVRFPGVDAVGHYFLRFASPSAFGDVSDQERRRYGRVLEQYYGFLDEHVGRMIDALGPDDLLLVVSAFGMEPLSPGKRVLERLVGNPAISGTHERAPDGFLLAFGAPVQPGRPPRASVVDVAPTILYFFGLPVGRDMEGFARTELFRSAFTAERPVTYIPSYGR
ncbi:MAG TPA: alkaline phosphatase family protein [Vicinamibacterales bacterium]|nr:alkaline phosphatase family protein [Vicinamibacterales bacterium]